jgi:hypothetical protein
VTPPELRALVSDSLALWGVPAAVSIAEDGVALRAPDGTPLRIRPASPEELPLRWWLERPGQRRPCTSVLGLLRGLRNAVGTGEAAEVRRLRVALPPGA